MVIVETVMVILSVIFVNEKSIHTNPYVGIVWNIIDGSISFAILVLYMNFNLKLLQVMHKRHRLEFKKHALQQITNVLGTAFCILTLIYADYIYLLGCICRLDFSYCKSHKDFTHNPSYGTETDIGIALLNGIMLIPLWAYFFFNKPHDCFKCLGKDP